MVIDYEKQAEERWGAIILLYKNLFGEKIYGITFTYQ